VVSSGDPSQHTDGQFAESHVMFGPQSLFAWQNVALEVTPRPPQAPGTSTSENFCVNSEKRCWFASGKFEQVEWFMSKPMQVAMPRGVVAGRHHANVVVEVVAGVLLPPHSRVQPALAAFVFM